MGQGFVSKPVASFQRPGRTGPTPSSDPHSHMACIHTNINKTQISGRRNKNVLGFSSSSRLCRAGLGRERQTAERIPMRPSDREQGQQCSRQGYLLWALLPFQIFFFLELFVPRSMEETSDYSVILTLTCVLWHGDTSALKIKSRAVNKKCDAGAV